MEENTEKYKARIEELFANLDIERERERAVSPEMQPSEKSEISLKKKRVVKQEYLTDTSDQAIQEFCKKKALEELEIVRQAFKDFQEELKDLVVLEQLVPPIAEFAEYAISFLELVDEDLDAEHSLDPEIEMKVHALKKIKAQFFANLYNKYKKK